MFSYQQKEALSEGKSPFSVFEKSLGFFSAAAQQTQTYTKMSLLNTRRSVQLLRSVVIQDVRRFSSAPSIKGAVYSVGQALRETGAALDSLGLRSIDKVSYRRWVYDRDRWRNQWSTSET